MRILATVFILLAACGPAVQAGTTAAAPAQASASLAGSYALRQVNGRDLPTASPTEPNVELTRGFLRLDPAGTFAVTLTGRRNQEPTPGDEQMRGTYAVAGDVLTMSGPNGPEGAVRFNFTRAGSTLMLRDDRGHVYTFVRQ